MRTWEASSIRNVAFVGHNDTGKTSLVSQLLFDAGAVNRAGRIEEGNTVTDFDDDEIARKHSISAAVAHCEWRDCKLNLIDTPGFGIFLMEARMSLQAADAAVITVSGVTGSEVSTEKVVRFASERGLPMMFVANKMDRDRASATRTMESLQKKYGREVIPVQLPIGDEREFHGVVDLVTMKALIWRDGSLSVEAIPSDLAETARLWHEGLVEKVAEEDDALMERFFEDGTLGEDELRSGLRHEFRERKIFPLFFTSALHGVGGRAILDAIVDLVPPPSEAPSLAATKGGSAIELDRSDAAPPVAIIFKTISDPFAGRLSILRVLSGTLQSDHAYWNSTLEHEERVGKLQLLQGKQQTAVGELRAGDIGAVAKLKDAHTGNTITTKDSGIVIPPLAYPESAISFAIEPKTKGDEDKLSTALGKIMEEDPTITFHRDEQTKELLISGQGQLHVEIVVERLHRRYGVDVILHPPKVPYRETVTRAADAHGRHKKQSGGHGQFADCRIKIEPLERGKEFEFVDEIFGGSIPRQFIPAVEKGIQEARMQGYLAGYPVVDFRVRLYDGQFHAVDSSEMAFKIAASMAFKEAMAQARPTLLEPVMKVDVTAPSEYMGDLMGDITSRRGRVEGMDSDGDSQTIRAHVPMSEMLNYAPTLRSITQGRGTFHMESSHYEEVPRSLHDRIIKAKDS